MKRTLPVAIGGELAKAVANNLPLAGGEAFRRAKRRGKERSAQPGAGVTGLSGERGAGGSARQALRGRSSRFRLL